MGQKWVRTGAEGTRGGLKIRPKSSDSRSTPTPANPRPEHKATVLRGGPPLSGASEEMVIKPSHFCLSEISAIYNLNTRLSELTMQFMKTHLLFSGEFDRLFPNPVQRLMGR